MTIKKQKVSEVKPVKMYLDRKHPSGYGFITNWDRPIMIHPDLARAWYKEGKISWDMTNGNYCCDENDYQKLCKELN